jgi:E3 ubiquitin-protein ligase HUWE1
VQALDALANPEYGLFTQVSSSSLTHPSPAATYQPRYSEYFVLFGRLLGKAFLEDIQVNVRLSTLVLKSLLGKEAGSLIDLEHFNREVHKNLVWMLDNNIAGVLDETFSSDVSVLGDTRTVDLVPNGSTIPVTEANKSEFVELKARMIMLHGIKEQMASLRQGFTDLVQVRCLGLGQNVRSRSAVVVIETGMRVIPRHASRTFTFFLLASLTVASQH